MVSRVKDISGKVFGSLTAQEFSHVSNRQAYWKYLCKCGKIHTARSNTVAYVAKTKDDPELPSCGCVELARKTKHGFRKANDTHPAYRVYRGMLDRCYNPKSPCYQWYGAKGVTVSPEWLGKPDVFVQWAINTGYKPGLHIDKDILSKEKGINPPVYGPETCMWVTAKTNVATATNRGNFGNHPNIRLSTEQVAEMLELYFSGQETNKSELARMFGLLSPSSVGRLISLAMQRAV